MKKTKDLGKNTKDDGKNCFYQGYYIKKGDFLFAFSRFFNNFAVKMTSYEKEVIHHYLTDGGICAAK